MIDISLATNVKRKNTVKTIHGHQMIIYEILSIKVCCVIFVLGLLDPAKSRSVDELR